MGIDIVPLAYKHKLDLSSDEAFANDISKRFSANIDMEYVDEEFHHTDILKIQHEHPKCDISITKKEPTEYDLFLYDVRILNENAESFEVYTHHIDMYMLHSPFRWGGFESSIWKGNLYTEILEELTEYRKYIKRYCDIVGCTKCLYVPDQSYPELIWSEAQEGLSYDELLAYIRQKKYLDDCECEVRKKKAFVLDLPAFLSEHKGYDRYPDVYLDVVMDDFRDLKGL